MMSTRVYQSSNLLIFFSVGPNWWRKTIYFLLFYIPLLNMVPSVVCWEAIIIASQLLFAVYRRNNFPVESFWTFELRALSSRSTIVNTE